MLLPADDRVIKAVSSVNSLKADHHEVSNETKVFSAGNEITLNTEKTKICFFYYKNRRLNVLQVH